MRKENIITLPNERLRLKSSRVHVIDKDTHEIIDNMKGAALDWEDSRPHEISAALAAVQIDHLKRIVIIRSNFDNKENRDFTVLINPEIVKHEGEKVEDFEGCLSVKDIYGKVPRFSKVRVKALDPQGKEVRFKAEGFLARVLQHEIDHTNGVVFVDHIKNKPESFYQLDKKGELKKLDYDKHIKTNSILWD